jgi:hypothetical protein
MTKQVVRMSEFTENCLQISPEQAIEDLQAFLKENPDFDKVFLIAINTKGGEFLHSWFRGRIACSESIAALQVSSDDMVRVLRGEEV